MPGCECVARRIFLVRGLERQRIRAGRESESRVFERAYIFCGISPLTEGFPGKYTTIALREICEKGSQPGCAVKWDRLSLDVNGRVAIEKNRAAKQEQRHESKDSPLQRRGRVFGVEGI